ncbi:MAG: hypothetical protein BMS9Abin26_2193 [Gammaproteobacteria bacterium]|nr:MAG: hypothetical protein BMS9Abin26_2193 [Gammaproteobacteria bacterium]
MEDLNAAIEESKTWPDDRKGDRESIAKCLNNAAGSLKEAITVWKDIIDNPTPQDEYGLSAMTLVGGERSRKLHAIGLDTISSKREIFKIIGGKVEYFSGLQDSLVEDAYPELKSGQSISERANEAVENMEKRIGVLEGLAKNVAA